MYCAREEYTNSVKVLRPKTAWLPSNSSIRQRQISLDQLLKIFLTYISSKKTLRYLPFTLSYSNKMTTADDAGFHRFRWVKDHMPKDDKLARSSAPHYSTADSDQKLTDDSIRFLKDNKIEHVISLNSQADSNDDLKTKLKNNDIAYTPLPVKDFHAPTSNELSKGNTEYRKHRNGTLVWCGYGHGRTGTMVTALQIYAEKDKSSPEKLSHDDYKKNNVEQKHQGTSTGQFEVLDELQN